MDRAGRYLVTVRGEHSRDPQDAVPGAVPNLVRAGLHCAPEAHRVLGVSLSAMRRHGGNKTRAAEDLKVSRRNLIRLVQKYGLEP